MERRTPHWATYGLLMLLAATGCRSMHSSVPPGPKFSPDGRQQPTVGFSTEPHPPNQSANPALNTVNNMAPGGNMAGMGGPQTGMPGSAVNNYGVPGGAAFGGLGTSGAAPGYSPSGAASGVPGTSAGGLGGLGSSTGAPSAN